MQNVLTLESNKYAIKIENFEGPLDLLCHLIDKNKMNIYDIKISQIADQYIEYINQMEEMNLEVTSEFLMMASTLLYIKSKGLLPNEVEAEEELTEEQLIARIIEYKKYKEITSKLEIEYDTKMLPEIYKSIVARNNEKINQNARNIERIALIETYTVGSKVKEMFRELIRKPKFVFNKLYSLSKCNKQEVVTAFTGLLELSRRNKVTTMQEKLFGDITVEKNKR